MAGMLSTYSPIDGTLVCERPIDGRDAIDAALRLATRGQADWAALPLEERGRILSTAVDHMVARKAPLAAELTRQMGRPIAHAPSEIGGLEERARHMIDIAAAALADVDPGPKPGFRRFIRRVPLGVIAVVAPWNYPYLTSVNAVIPALMAGDAVILKPSHQTPLTAERYAEAFAAAGLPPGVFQALHLDHDGAEALMGDPRVDFVAFTGSVAGGRAAARAAATGGAGSALELGGKDPAYVRADADLDHAVANLVDGAFFNAGQSCCAIERIYVHERLYDSFVEGAVALAGRYRLGDPLDPATDLGPMVRREAADFVRGQIDEATAAGAVAHLDPAAFPAAGAGTPYCAPQILTGVDHTMRVMSEETFGPVVGIMRVASDEEAVTLMNDSAYGLTAAIWTADPEAAVRIGDRLATGTVFMNRCDYLDPALAWTGVGDSGRGCSLSHLGYAALTRPKSFHLRTAL